MLNTLGKPATGKDFFPRNSEIDKIYRALHANSNIYLSAPRRVGKTSIMQHLELEPRPGYTFVYVDLEDCKSSEEAFKLILHEIILSKAKTQTLQRLRTKAVKWFEKHIGQVKSLEVAVGKESQFALKIDVQNTDAWKEKCKEMLAHLPEKGERLVLLLDEFPQLIENILDTSDGTQAAKMFLLQHRNLRLAPELASKVNFILTGSISLNNTVGKLGDLKSINDLDPILLDPLSTAEAKDMAERILSAADQFIQNDSLDYLVSRIDWPIPFHVKLLLKGILELPRGNDKTIRPQEIDQAFESIFAPGNKPQFDHYFSRLPKAYKDKELAFVRKLLNALSGVTSISIAQVHDLAVEHDVVLRYHDILQTLESDGYLFERRELNNIQFRSLILKTWWQRHESRKQ